MPGAGSAQVGFAVEDSFRTLPGTPTWYEPGKNIQIGSASLENQLQRNRQPDDPRPAGSREGNLEGALSVTFSLTDTNFHDLVFADAGTALASTSMLAPTETWYLSSDVPGNTQERFLEGAAATQVAWNYNQGEDVTVQLTITYTQEYDPADPDAPGVPASINQPTNDDIVPWHGTNFDLDAAAVEKLQSLTLEVANLARPQRGQSRYIQGFVVGAYEPSLTVQAILQDDTQRDLAYGGGGSDVTKPQNTIGSVPATLGFSNPAGTVADYNLSNLQPTSYDWSDLVSADTDVTEPTTYHVTDVQVA